MAESDELKKKKKEGKLSKLLMGVVIGGAIGSVLGVTLSDKENRDFIKKKSRETWEKAGILLGETLGQKKKKKGFWHKLNNLLLKKDQDTDDDND